MNALTTLRRRLAVANALLEMAIVYLMVGVLALVGLVWCAVTAWGLLSQTLTLGVIFGFFLICAGGCLCTFTLSILAESGPDKVRSILAGTHN